MLGYLYSRYSSDKKRLRQRTSLICPRRTGKAVAILVACVAGAFLLLVATAHAEDAPRTMYVCTQSDPLNVREKPSLHAEKVARLERGEEVTVIRTQDGWALITGTWEAGKGWASLEFLSDEPVELPVEQQELPARFFEVEED